MVEVIVNRLQQKPISGSEQSKRNKCTLQACQLAAKQTPFTLNLTLSFTLGFVAVRPFFKSFR